MKKELTLLLLFLAGNLAAQNIGIGTTNPVAPLDVYGKVLFRGVNSNVPVNTIAAVEFFTGRGSNGALPSGLTQADLAFNYGGPGGGLRHFISSRHDIFPNSAGNAIDFYINNSSGMQNSNAPGIGNLRILSVSANGVKIDSNYTLEFGEGIAGKEMNAGKIGYRTYSSDALDIVGAGTNGFNRKIKFWTEGGAEFNAHVNVTSDLSVGRDMSVADDLTVGGNINAGLTYYFSDYTLSAGNLGLYTIGCPAGSSVVSGGGGHRDFNTAAADIIVNYSGPDLSNPLSLWRLMVHNDNSSASRTIRVYVVCSRIK